MNGFEQSKAINTTQSVGSSRSLLQWNQRRSDIAWAYLLILPTILGFLIFIAGPVITDLGLAFFRYDIVSAPKFIGLANFERLAADPRAMVVLQNTVYYTFGMVIFDLVLAMALAVAINSKIPHMLKRFYQAIFFFPILVSGAAIAIVWQLLLASDIGIINYFLGQIGIEKIPWILASDWVKPSVIMVTVWNGVGFNMILILAGLQGIPNYLYEAADIDGANGFQKFSRITVPLLSPVIFFIIVKGIIGVLQLFEAPFVLTEGGPGDASRTVLMYLYESFRQLKIGYASSVGFVLFGIILVITIIQFVVSRYWVFYDND